MTPCFFQFMRFFDLFLLCSFFLLRRCLLLSRRLLLCGLQFLKTSLQTGNLLILHLDLITLVLDGGQQALQLIVVDIERIEGIYSVDEVTQDIHVVGEGIERSAVDTTVQTYVRRLGGHETEVVGSLEIVPVLIDARIIGDAQTVSHTVEFVEGLTLHGVTQPAADITLLIDP